MLENIIITKLKKIPDERGAIYHMLRNDDKHFQKFGEIYFSIAYPGVIKGWHEHTKQVQNYCVVEGMIKLVMYDNRKESQSYQKLQELFLGDENYCLVTIPTGIIMGYKCIGNKKSILANCSTLPHDPSEMISYDPIGGKIPYNWDIKFK
jgi:dTDP-4-dehydrorhamnose 3,5-epimerase